VRWLLAAICAAVFSTTVRSQTDAFGRASREGMPVTVTGPLTVLVQDDFERGRSNTMYFIRDERTGRSLRVVLDGQVRGGIRTGTRVTLAGRLRESEIYAPADQPGLAAPMSIRSMQPSAGTNLTTVGDQRTLVMVGNFSDASVSCSMQSITETMFTDPNGLSVANLYRMNSLGQVSLSGDVVGPFQLEYGSTSCDESAWARALDSKASAGGIDVAAYQRKVYVMPPNACLASGLGTINGNPSHAWVFRCDLRGVFAHELGHNFGMNHAATPTSEIDDSTDPMAFSSRPLRGVNAPHRQQLGWHRAGGVQVIEGDGTYDLAPLAMDPSSVSGPQVLMIRKPDSGEYYYLSYRVAVGFDQYIDLRYTEKLSIHRYKGDGSTTFTYRLAGLGDGESFTDVANGLTVTLLSHSPTNAWVNVSFRDACSRATPLVSITPSNQSGAAGGSLKYQVSVSNKDGASCAASSFSLSASGPSGWETALSADGLTVAPGTTGNVELTVKSASSAPAGTYTVSPSVNSAVSPLHSTAASASYTIVTDTTPPTTPSGLTATANQKLKQIELSWNAATDYIGVVGYSVMRNGAVVGKANSTEWSDTSWSPGATYTYTVTAYDQAGNASEASSSATVKINGGDGGTGSGSGGGNGGGGKPK
jgi:hypothetical protein